MNLGNVSKSLPARSSVDTVMKKGVSFAPIPFRKIQTIIQTRRKIWRDANF
jgi:hypothetical protein